MSIKGRDQKQTDLPPDLSQPAQRALAGAGIRRLSQLARLHGIGPKSIKQLREALRAQGLSFARNQK